MKIIHTSDWHLGQFFYTRSRAFEHQSFLDWLLQQITQHQVDALIVAGDIFDTGSPPSYARELYNHFVVALQQTGCQLVILAGNHDSVAMLNESRELLACLNTRVIASAGKEVDQQLVILKNARQQPAAILCAIPYLRPRDIQLSQAGLDSHQKQQNLLQAITDHYQQCYRAALDLRTSLGLPALPIIATGHLTALGTSSSDSVRDIYIGTLDAFPASAFPPADYIALGHIHRPQQVAGQAHIRYSGSPIALSFDEPADEKSVCLVECGEGQPLTVTPLPIPCFQQMKTVKGSLEEIERQLYTLTADSNGRPVWLDIEVTQQEYLSDLQQRIEAITDGLPAEVLLLRRSRDRSVAGIRRINNETLNELTPEEVFQRRLAAEEQLSQQDQLRLMTLYRQTLEQLQHTGQEPDC
ncbi:exonuclease subunit SbcD [Tatumella sp. JGM130]|mgnify:CR=1 FL=1|uniref:exonuclease subunit SbcD n=1 Tax=Tatumella sp. JGM130 TaxID=2799797 RepID=UPI001BAFCA13|nr:exonuclease subunit SbcD [Tatumella sp. JGM130]MBS0893711.1 exonuclease subunit SbcD [Tatumella sp. JGM130]